MRHVGSDPQAERGRGEVNLSPIQVLTLRPRVGGFLGGRGGTRRERDEDNEVEVKDITVRFKGEGV